MEGREEQESAMIEGNGEGTSMPGTLFTKLNRITDNEGNNGRCLASSTEEPDVVNLQVRVCEGSGRATAQTYSVILPVLLGEGF